MNHWKLWSQFAVYSVQTIQVWLLDLLWRVCVIIRFKKDSVNIWRPNVQLFPDSTSCQMMNFWRFCLRLKILLLFSLICENALRILPRFVVLRALLLWLTMQINPSRVQVVICFVKNTKCVKIRGDTLTQSALSPGNNKRLKLFVKACTNKNKLSLQFYFLLWQATVGLDTYSGNSSPICYRWIRNSVRRDFISESATFEFHSGYFSSYWPVE